MLQSRMTPCLPHQLLIICLLLLLAPLSSWTASIPNAEFFSSMSQFSQQLECTAQMPSDSLALIHWLTLQSEAAERDTVSRPQYHHACSLAVVKRCHAEIQNKKSGSSKDGRSQKELNRNLGAALILLAISFRQRQGIDPDALSHSSLCFAESRKLLGSIESSIPMWDRLGPFPIGKMESEGDTLGPLGGIRVAERDRGNSSHTYRSEIVDYGVIKWLPVRPSQTQQGGHVIEVKHEGVKWNDIAQSISMAALETQTWFVGSLFVASKGTFSVHCTGVSYVFVDDRSLIGDQYHTGRTISSVSLEAGVHKVRLRMRVKVQGSFWCSFGTVASKATSKPGSALRIYSPAFLPDLVEDAQGNFNLLSPWISVPVNNLSPKHLGSLRFSTPEGSLFRVASTSDDRVLSEVYSIPSDPSIPTLAPGQVSYVQVKLEKDAAVKTKGCPNAFMLTLTATPSSSGATPLESNTLTLQYRCPKWLGQSFIISFLDGDGTVSQAGVVPPAHPCPSHTIRGSTLPRCPILVSSHGTGVSAGSMADSFKMMESKNQKDYTFGVDGAWVLTPARHGAHNHEGPVGLGTILSAIHALERFTGQHALYATRLADSRRIISVGHSMGGHGAWLYATHYPDTLLCAAPMAGWISKEFYSDSNRVFEEDVAVSHSDMSLQGLLRAATTENNVDVYASNLAGIPVLARVGQDDKTTAPWFTRKMARIVNEWNVKGWRETEATNASSSVLPASVSSLVTLSEIPKQQHWWWDTSVANDGGVMNDPTMRKFYSSCIKRRNGLPPLVPKHFTLTTHNPAYSGSKGGLLILGLRRPFQLGKIEVARGENQWVLTTSNILRFTVRLTPHILSVEDLPADGLIIDRDSRISKDELERLMRSSTEEMDLCRADGKWKVCTYTALTTPHRSISTSGPMRAIYSRPFIFVIGTDCSAECQSELNAIAVFVANTFAMASEGATRIVQDVDWISAQSSDHKSSSPNLILIGGVATNKLSRLLAADEQFPLTFLRASNDGPVTGYAIKGSPCSYSGPRGIGAMVLFPMPSRYSSPSDPALGLLIDGVDSRGFRLMQALAEPTIPPMVRVPFSNLLPEYVILGADSEWKGVGGWSAAGYLDSKWRYQADRAYDTC